MLKIKRILHWLYMLLPSIFIFILYGYAEDKVFFLGINIPKWIFLVMSILYASFIIYTIIIKFAVCEDFEEADDYIGLKKYSIAESLHYTLTELMACLLGMFCLNVFGNSIEAWEKVVTFFGIIVLFMYGIPFVISIFSIFSINGSILDGIETKENSQRIKKLVIISGIVAMVASLSNLSLSLIISSMKICRISYLVLIPIIIFEWIFYIKSVKKIYQQKEELVIDDNEKKERIS